jgi:HEAT repeat protein
MVDTDALLRKIAKGNWQLEYLDEATRKELLDPATLPELLKLLHTNEFFAQIDLMWALVLIGEPAKPGLLDGLKSEHWQARRTTAEVIGFLNDSTVLPYLLPLLKDEHELVRIAATESIGMIGDATAAPDLIEAMRDEERSIYAEAVYALCEISERYEMPELHLLLRDQDQKLRIGAAYILGEKAGVVGIQALLELSYIGISGDKHEWERAVDSLVAIGEPAIPQLVDALQQDDDEVLRRCIIAALGRIGHSSAFPALVAMIDDEDSLIQQEAVWAVGQMGEEALPVLFDAFQRDEGNIGWMAGNSLVDIGKPAVPGLLDLLSNPQAETRKRAADMLWFIHANRRSDIQEDLIRFLSESQNKDAQEQVVHVLTQIATPEALAAVEAWRSQNSM